LFQEGDTGDVNPKDASRLKGKVYELFGKAVEDAAKAYQLKKGMIFLKNYNYCLQI